MIDHRPIVKQPKSTHYSQTCTKWSPLRNGSLATLYRLIIDTGLKNLQVIQKNEDGEKAKYLSMKNWPQTVSTSTCTKREKVKDQFMPYAVYSCTCCTSVEVKTIRNNVLGPPKR